MKTTNIPLGRKTDYSDIYAPELLCPIPRAQSRQPMGLATELPFTGADIWNAWELTWLAENGQPVVATAELVVPAESPNIVESKSLKLFLNSFAMSTFSSPVDVAGALATDIGACVGAEVGVTVAPVASTEARPVSRLAGACLDRMAVACADREINPALLEADSDTIVTEDLHTHVLRSLCPVTAQPDIGSLQISYRGPRIDPASLLRYVVSYRQHSGFHEACVEQMFLDLVSRCRPEKLSIQARYLRRGGIDINPFRSNDDSERPVNLRLWRQ